MLVVYAILVFVGACELATLLLFVGIRHASDVINYHCLYPETATERG
jgi:hypothetical protein